MSSNDSTGLTKDVKSMNMDTKDVKTDGKLNGKSDADNMKGLDMFDNDVAGSIILKSKEAKADGKDAKADAKDAKANANQKIDNKHTFTVSKKNAYISNLVKVALEKDQDETTLQLDVASEQLALIVEYMNEHKGVEAPLVPKPVRYKTLADCITYKWDAEFLDRIIIDKPREIVFRLMLAANYMEIPGLLHLIAARLACSIKGQHVDKIKEILDEKFVEKADHCPPPQIKDDAKNVDAKKDNEAAGAAAAAKPSAKDEKANDSSSMKED